MVDARELAGPFDWRKILAVVFSVGIRPCTGAILVLVFALTQGMFWAGVAATFAMAFGTAITVAALATLALGSRELALKLGGRTGAFANAVWTHLRHRRLGADPSLRRDPVRSFARTGAAVLSLGVQARRHYALRHVAPMCIRHGAISAGLGTYCSLVSRPENGVSICRAGLHSASKAS